jgi:hypothetical protein
MESTMWRGFPNFEEASHHRTYVFFQPNIEKLFDVYCDASSMGITGFLMQDGRAIAYASRQLRHPYCSCLHKKMEGWFLFCPLDIN